MSTPARSPHLSLLVLRTADMARCRQFYETIGLMFVQEQHGSGPLHFSATSHGMVLELYPQGNQEPSNCRLGFTVPDVEACLQAMRGMGADISREVHQTEWGMCALIKDPDGRTVELTQRTHG